MYRLTWKLLALFSLIPPMLAGTVPVGREAKELENRAVQTSGTGTWYTPGLGSCGKKNNGAQLVVALSKNVMNTKKCGKTVRITSNGKTVDGQIVDTCEGCSSNRLDLSPALFEKFASLGKGVIEIEWEML